MSNVYEAKIVLVEVQVGMGSRMIFTVAAGAGLCRPHVAFLLAVCSSLPSVFLLF
jgi:N-acetylglutamate synthase/N-acetylornithine aminotransferase